MSDSESPKKIESLTLENFTVFEKATLDFCPGINVLIGENSTGKTHVLKASYGLIDVFLAYLSKNGKSEQLVDNSISTMFPNVFGVKNEKAQALIRSFSRRDSKLPVFPEEDGQENSAGLSLSIRDKKLWIPIDYEITSKSSKIACPSLVKFSLIRCYLPSDEFLSKNEGFLSLYEHREIPYSSIYYDLALALNSLPLREERLTEVKPILDSLQTIIAGENEKKSDFIKQENGRFYFELPEGKLDVHLMADGYRKFGMLWYLLRNGSITKNSVLFWDEPETSLNPKLIRELVKILQQLAAIGVQIFIATHDYLLSYELSLLNEYSKNDQVDIKFFSLLHKPSRNAGVVVEAASTLSEISHNPILEAYSAHYDHEAELFYNAGKNHD